MSSLTISVLRAGIMSIISILNKKYKLRLGKYTIFSISLYITYLYNPFSIFSISCIFSYLAILSIIVYQNEINSYLDIFIKKIINYSYYNNSSYKKVLYQIFTILNRILAVYLSVQILVLPVQIYYFSKIELISVISNILFYPIIFLLVLIACLIFFLSFIPIISTFLFNCETLLLYLIINLTKIFSGFNITINVPKPNIIFIIIYYIILILFRVDKKAILVLKKSHLKIIRKIKYIVAVLLVVCLCFWYVYVMYVENYIYFFNVEQGNMAFIRYNRKNILVDCGSTTNNLAINTLENFCKEKAIKKIDLCVITHFHDDHMNLIINEKLYENLKIEKVIYTEPKLNNDNFLMVKKITEKYKIPLLDSDIFDIYSFKNIDIYILSPGKNDKILADDIENANSLIVLMSINDNNFLFMGDATTESENKLFNNIERIEDNNLKCNLKEKLRDLNAIQIGHHGSKTSTSDEFLNKISVKNAIISAKKEKFGHPNIEVLERLKKRNIKIFITQENGAIKFNIY